MFRGSNPASVTILVEHVDVLPTICDLLGVDVPDSVQGRSLLALLRNEPVEEWREACFSQIGDIEMIRTKGWKLNVYGGEPGELFDLGSDPHEFFNQIGESEQQALIGELRERMRAWRVANEPVFCEPGILA